MKQQEIDEQIKEMFQEEAKQLKAPESMKRQIDRRLSEKTGAPSGYRKIQKKTVLILAAALVLLLGSITGYAAVKSAEVRGYSNVEPDSRNYKDLQRIAQDAGYSFTGVEEFSNGFVFENVKKSYSQKYDAEGQPMGEQDTNLILTYRRGTDVVQISLFPSREELALSINPKRLLKEFEWNGIKVYQTIYIHFEMPSNWEELITEEDRKLLDEGIAGGGVDDYNSEIIRHTIYSFQWQKDGIDYLLSAEGLDGSERLIEEMKVIAREWVEANEK